MGLLAFVYRSVTSPTRGPAQVVLVNVEGTAEPSDDAPAMMLVPSVMGNCIAVLADCVATRIGDGHKLYRPKTRTDMVGPMADGCFVATSDSRFAEAVTRITGAIHFYGAVPTHTRFETQEDYDALSR